MTLTNDANGNPGSNPVTTFAVYATSTDARWHEVYLTAAAGTSTSPVWLTDAQIDGLSIGGLNPATTYAMQVKAKNQDDDETAFATTSNFTTAQPTALESTENPSPTRVEATIFTEISFAAPPNDVVMSSSLPGLTGGSAYGTSTFSVVTNSPTGYQVTLSFASSTAMIHEGSNSVIDNFTPTTVGVPDQFLSVSGGEAEFGYTVIGVTDPTTVDDSFKISGSTCGSGTNAPHECWYNKADATIPELIIDAASSTPPTGATSTVVFQVQIGADPEPTLELGYYVATVTLTAFVQ